MEIKLRQIVDSTTPMRNVAQKELPIKTAYWMNKNVQKLDSELQSFNKTRETLLKKYKPEGEDNIPEESFPDANKEFEELLETMVKVNLHMFQLEDFGDIQVSAADMQALDFMIVIKETE